MRICESTNRSITVDRTVKLQSGCLISFVALSKRLSLKIAARLQVTSFSQNFFSGEKTGKIRRFYKNIAFSFFMKNSCNIVTEAGKVTKGAGFFGYM